MYALQYHPDVVRRDLQHLDPPIQRKILAQIQKKLATAPLTFGQPLRYALKGYRRLRVDDYRVIYAVDTQKRVVTIWLIDQRKDDQVYIAFLKRLHVGK